MCAQETPNSLGICQDWPFFAVCMKKAWVLSYPLRAQRRLWSHWADLSLRCVHMSFWWFCHNVAQMYVRLLYWHWSCNVWGKMPTILINALILYWLCWGLTSQSTIFQSCRDGAIASWVINQYFRGVKCLAQGHNTAAVGLEPRTSRSGVRHSTTEPPRSPHFVLLATFIFVVKCCGKKCRMCTCALEMELPNWKF